MKTADEVADAFVEGRLSYSKHGYVFTVKELADVLTAYASQEVEMERRKWQEIVVIQKELADERVKEAVKECLGENVDDGGARALKRLLDKARAEATEEFKKSHECDLMRAAYMSRGREEGFNAAREKAAKIAAPIKAKDGGVLGLS